MKRLISMFSLAAMLVILVAPSALAAPAFIIPIDTVIVEPPGSFTVLADVETPPELIGATCLGFAAAENGESVHPNNDIIIETGDSEAVLEDVEGSSNKVTDASGAITLGPRVELTLHMGEDGIFSGGLVVVIDVNCTPPTTLPPPLPEIGIVKTADVEFYVNLTGEFTIDVTNTGPVPLHDVHVTDDYAVAIDPGSDCPAVIGDLAVGETSTYSCTIAGLDGVSSYDNVATAIGTGPLGTEVTATDNAQVFPIKDVTVTTQAPTTTQAPVTTQAPGTTSAPDETLPVTGINGDQMEGFGMAGIILVMGGIVMLSGAAVVGQRRTGR
ncbi:MAG: hypothetical protein M3132_08395 [Actinomycetia bacterium]|nr:hypothetical protein [Actinomycetes bacterium]